MQHDWLDLQADFSPLTSSVATSSPGFAKSRQLVQEVAERLRSCNVGRKVAGAVVPSREKRLGKL